MWGMFPKPFVLFKGYFVHETSKFVRTTNTEGLQFLSSDKIHIVQLIFYKIHVSYK
jgi:hypothetical protein